MKDLQVSESTVQWLQSIFMLVNGIMIPVTAFLIERFTSRQLFLTAMSIFAVGTLLCAVGIDFSMLLIGRVLQAAGAGIMMPLMQTILFLTFPKEKRGTAMGLFGLVIAFAPAIGPTLSGILVEHLTWRSVFYVVFPRDYYYYCFHIPIEERYRNNTSKTRYCFSYLIYTRIWWLTI